MNFYVSKMLRYLEIHIFMVAILEIQNSGHTGIYANVNIGFQISDAISFSKMWISIDCEQKYIVNPTIQGPDPGCQSPVYPAIIFPSII